MFVCVYKRKQFKHFVALLEGPDMFKNEVEGCIWKPEITNKVENVRIWKCMKTYMGWTSLQYCVYFSKCWEWAMNAWIFRIFTWDQRTDWQWSRDFEQCLGFGMVHVNHVWVIIKSICLGWELPENLSFMVYPCFRECFKICLRHFSEVSP